MFYLLKKQKTHKALEVGLFVHTLLPIPFNDLSSHKQQRLLGGNLIALFAFIFIYWLIVYIQVLFICLYYF